MKTTLALTAIACLLGACAPMPDERGPRQNRMRDCPPGMVNVCETRQKQPIDAPDEEIPAYERCVCESIVN